MLGTGLFSLVIALSVAAVPSIARIARGAAQSIMQQEYMEAGRAVGLGDAALIWRYLARNCWPTILIYMTLQLGQAILLGAALSFLGLGAQPPTAELGSMAADGRKFLQIAPTSRPCRARRSSSSFSLSTSWATRCATPSIPSSGNKEASV